MKKKTKKKKPVSKITRKNPEIIYLIKHFYRIQNHRIAFGNQIRALKASKLSINPLEEYFATLHTVEKDMEKYIKNSLKDEVIWTDFLKKTKGIGGLLAAGLVNLVNIKKARHISSLWKFAGLDVVDGKAPRLKKGQKTTWNPLMRQLCWKIAKSFLMTKSPYRKFYDERKKHEELSNKERKKGEKLTKIHIHNRCMRFMIKRFLSDFWIAWRELEGLEVSLPYSVAKLGHKYQKTSKK